MSGIVRAGLMIVAGSMLVSPSRAPAAPVPPTANQADVNDATSPIFDAHRQANRLFVLSDRPEEPILTHTDPPANDNSPRVHGIAEGGTTVRLHTTPDCSGSPAATGPAGKFATSGLRATVAEDSTTNFWAAATDPVGNDSGCSVSSISYVEDSTRPLPPNFTEITPGSISNDNSPRLKGVAEGSATVRIYNAPTRADCIPGNLAATGTASELASTGIQVWVPDDSTTTFRATATDSAGNTSACSDHEYTADDPVIFREYYDLVADPWQLTNYLGDADPANDPSPQTIDDLHTQLATDLTCAGQDGLAGRPPCGSPLPSGPRLGDRPNVLFIVTDDQRFETLNVMPSTRRLFDDQGTYFPNAFATTPLCCPARASILTGRYAHNHGVRDNFNAPALLDQDSTIERRLQEAGYTTGLYGKFLNGWSLTENPLYFDRWSVFGNGAYIDFPANEQGQLKTIPQYATSYVADKAVEFIEQAEGDDTKPWFLYVAPTAPHAPFTPEPRYQSANVPAFVANPAFSEADLTDKPPYIQDASVSRNRILATRTEQLRMLKSVDDLVSRTFSALAERNEADSTLAFFISDNGYMWGEHGLLGKGPSYTYSVKVPLYLRWPQQLAGGVDDHRIVANIDLAATVLDGAGITSDAPLDGVSLLGGESRNRILLERLSGNRGAGSTPSWASIRTATVQYTEYYGSGTISYVEDSTPPIMAHLRDTDPSSPANHNTPKVRGSAAADSTVRLYKAATADDCTPASLVATGTVTQFASPGFQVSVPDNSITRFRATVTDRAGNAAGCSLSSKGYVEDSIPPRGPTFTSITPTSPANNNFPKLKGTAQAKSTVKLYKARTTADCTPGRLAASGPAAAFASPGLTVSVPNDSTTRFRARAADAAGNVSVCSADSVVYREDSTLPPSAG